MRRILLFLTGLLPLLTSCAYISVVGATMLITDSDEEEGSNLPPAASSASAVAISPLDHITLHYTLFDAESDPAGITVEFSTDGGTNYSSCTELAGSESEGTASLSAGPSWIWHVFVWDAPADVSGFNRDLRVKITPTDTLTGIQGTSWSFPPILWKYNGIPTASVQDPGTVFGNVTIRYTLIDPEADPADIVVEYSTDGGVNFTSASKSPGDLSEGLAKLVTATTGHSHDFLWNSFPDIGGGDLPVLIRITPTDTVSGAQGSAGTSPSFTVRNSKVMTIAGRGTHAYGAVSGAVSDSNGILYFSERYGHRVFAMNTSSGTVVGAGITLNPGQLKRIAGTGVGGYNGDHILSVGAQLNDPGGLALDLASPQNLYIADTANHRIRRVDGVTGYITTLTGDGTSGTDDACPAIQGRLSFPRDVCIDPFGNVFIADTGNNVIRAVNLGAENLAVGGSVIQPQRILSICGAFPPNPLYGGDGGAAPSALLNAPEGITFDGLGHLYIADTGNQRVRAVNTLNPTSGPQPIVLGNVTVTAGNIDTIAGIGGQGYAGDDGSAVGATVLLDSPCGLLVLPGGILLFSERMNHTVRAVHTGAPGAPPIGVGSKTLTAGWITTVAGQGPSLPGSSGDGNDSALARLDTPGGLAVVGGGVVICEAGNRCARLFNPNPMTGSVSITASKLTLNPGVIDTLQSSPGYPVLGPAGLDYRSNNIFAADASGHRVLKVDTLTGAVVPIAGDGFSGFSGDSGPALSARFNGPSGVVIDALSGKVALVADTGNQRIRAVHFDMVTGGAVTAFGVTVNPGEVETLPGTLGQLTFPAGLASGSGGDLFIADTGGNRIVRVDRTTGALTTVAGTGTAGSSDGARLTTAAFSSPGGLAVSNAGNLYVADTGNHTLRVVNLGATPIIYGSGPSQITIAPGDVGRIGGTAQTPGWDGEGREAWLSLLYAPVGVEVDGFGNVTFSERGNHRVRRVLAVAGTLVALAGGGSPGFNGDGLPRDQTLFDSPEGLCSNGLGDFFLADRNNGRIRRFRP